MELPELTHLQALIVAVVSRGETSGKSLRDVLASCGADASAPAFYQLMARIERSGWVQGRYHVRTGNGQTTKERRYRVTGKGALALAAAQAFYDALGSDSR